MGGKRFTDNFAEFIEKYGSRYMTDMYAAGFILSQRKRQSGVIGLKQLCLTGLICLHYHFIKNFMIL